MTHRTLAQWLSELERRHPVGIELGLDRVGAVFRQLGLDRFSIANRVITVAGTNGKGSTVAMIESVARAHGMTTAAYTSPHLQRFNERLTLSGQELADASWVEALEHIEQQRGNIRLTYFEMTTLAAFWLIAERRPQLAILEVGLGGRLDAVNVLDADVAVITTIAHDHAAFLGDDLAQIGREKAGIMRACRPVVLGSRDMVASVIEHANALPVAECRQLGHDFDHKAAGASGEWQWLGSDNVTPLAKLPDPGLPLDNAATALQALCDAGVELSLDAVCTGLTSVRLPGRMQWHGCWCLDVAHNPHAATHVKKRLSLRPRGRRVALLGMLSDKDIEGVVAALMPVIDEWLLISLEGPRGMTADQLAERIEPIGVPVRKRFDAAADGLQWLRQHADEFDEALICGSFLTVGAALADIGKDGEKPA
ncbi:bifunctional tetrahydrofolate synthase/dihydrofolate synthase [Kushneria phosphatilytica]|uniref:Dihydrofolate synthase/folylpolyglutamate synthase n=1 Tax=Kushneria phosphatilytica TaxID=657387 RepID=A0A1S1NYG8_9GAMM|nr:bifunctional tetrahydrofolate synthase/dihydrofolate synthase [Kushneria phosphatilytica]OHV12937.1 bifunctional folylpolyglutamate synthase/dihydrofolate synthase [Kushneria phosphatilytica]QEL10803.1 bifunctional tetrahydrofolate synthase/dihydrofolate synthase [Kushneria phosphatilytica]